MYMYICICIDMQIYTHKMQRVEEMYFNEGKYPREHNLK